MKMLHECRATHVLGVIQELEFDGGILFYLIRGKVKVSSN